MDISRTDSVENSLLKDSEKNYSITKLRIRQACLQPIPRN